MKALKHLNRLLLLFMTFPLLVYYFFPEVPIPDGPPNSFRVIAATIHNTDTGLYNFLFVAWCWWAIGFFWLYFRVIINNHPEKLALVRKFAVLSIVLSCAWLSCGALMILFCEPSLECFFTGLIIGSVFSFSMYFSYFTYVIFFILASRNLYGSYFLAPLLWLFLPLVALFEEYLRPYLGSAKA